MVNLFLICVGQNKKPICRRVTISIDSLFGAINIDSANYRSIVFTRINEKILQRLDSSGIITYIPNYKLENKLRSDFHLSGSLGFDQQKQKYFIEGNIRDTLNEKIPEYGGSNSQRIIIDAKESKLYSPAYIGISFGKIIKQLLPTDSLLQPKNSDEYHPKTFSFDLFDSDLKADDRINESLKGIINNSFVFHQPTFKKVFFSVKNYNYFPNYRSRFKANADYKLSVKLIARENSFVLTFIPSGKDMNLTTPEPINLELVLNRDRILNGDFSEAIYKISAEVNLFTLMQLAY